MENRKTSIIIYPADFLASVHNFKKSEIANLIVAICEFNLFGATSVKLSELNKKRFDAIQQVIANHNEKWRQTCEINAQNAKRAGLAVAKRTLNERSAKLLSFRQPVANRRRSRRMRRNLIRIMIRIVEKERRHLWIT